MAVARLFHACLAAGGWLLYGRALRAVSRCLRASGTAYIADTWCLARFYEFHHVSIVHWPLDGCLQLSVAVFWSSWRLAVGF